jgi:hypothetical protein
MVGFWSEAHHCGLRFDLIDCLTEAVFGKMGTAREVSAAWAREIATAACRPRRRSNCELKFRKSQFREADQRLELVSAGLAFPQVPHAACIQIFRPFRQEDRFPALGAFIDWS